MVEIRVLHGPMAMQIFTGRQDIVALERCQEIDVDSGIGRSHAEMVMNMRRLRLRRTSDVRTALQFMDGNKWVRENR